MQQINNPKWGFLRETKEAALEAGIDAATGLHRTGLEEYLNVIFPSVSDWVHDKSIGELNGVKRKMRPDYRSEKLKMVIEFDGLQHYTNPSNILKDYMHTKEYEEGGYRVIRIPYFIQLTNEVVRTMFGVEVDEPLFSDNVPSLAISVNNTPAFLCPEGIKRMATELRRFPSQMETNLMALKKEYSEANEIDL
ncbi:MAG: DUF559 domain-containing protein, partial [Alistipes sp.]|nr:DUF559 domain-containing protein [Alistipes sp.]